MDNAISTVVSIGAEIGAHLEAVTDQMSLADFVEVARQLAQAEVGIITRVQALGAALNQTR